MTSTTTEPSLSPIFISPTASTYIYPPRTHPPSASPSSIRAFHASLPCFAPTPLIPLPFSLLSSHSSSPHNNDNPPPSCQPNTRPDAPLKLFLKLESPRLSLPSFKPLGATYATFLTLCDILNLPTDITLTPLPLLARRAREAGVVLFAATDGNHGSAVAWFAGVLGLSAVVILPGWCADAVGERVGRAWGRGRGMGVDLEADGEGKGEGKGEKEEGNASVKVQKVQGDYDDAVATAAEMCRAMNEHAQRETGGGVGMGVHIQDNAFDNYTTIPHYVVDGYTTMFLEIAEQLADLGLTADVIVSPVGTGSLASTAVKFAKSAGKDGDGDSSATRNGEARKTMKVLTVEPQSAPGLNANLQSFHTSSSTIPLTTTTTTNSSHLTFPSPAKTLPFSVPTSKTIMDGLCCPTPSPTAWPILSSGVDVSVTISERACHDAVLALRGEGLDAGPCGAAVLAGLTRIWAEEGSRKALELGFDEEEDAEDEDGGERVKEGKGKREKVVVLLCTEGGREYDVPI